MLEPGSALAGAATGNPRTFDLPGAGSSALDWSDMGARAGGTATCLEGAYRGALAGAEAEGVGAIPGAIIGCMAAGAVGVGAGALNGAAAGFFLGGFNLPGAGLFEWGPSQINNPWDY
jgi:hypothetical protein